MNSPATLGSRASNVDPLLGILLGGKYRVESLLGRGATGNVYRAIQEPIGRAVAVKILRVDLPPEELHQFEVRFLREASQAGVLQHPNVVTVHDFGRGDDGTCYIVMELLRGRSLKDAMKAGPMTPRHALEIFDQVVRGLRAAHAQGMVHRDVKPGNIFLIAGDDGNERVKLLDFGLVKDLDAVGTYEGGGVDSLVPEDDPSGESTVTRHGLFLGTPHYVAPEQARGARVDGRADLYSAGVVLYRMLTGVLPYYDRDPSVMAMAHVSVPYPPMSARAPDVPVPENVEAVVRRCMEKLPERRYADADALLAEIGALRRQLDAEAGVYAEATASLVAPLPVVAPPAKPARPLLWIAAFLLLGAATVGLVVLLLWPRPSPPPPVAAAPAVVDAAPAAPEQPQERTVNVFLASAPAGATVLLNGQEIGATPFVWRDTVGLDEKPQLSFVFRKEGYAEATLPATLDGGEVVLNATLEALHRARAERAPGATEAAPAQPATAQPAAASASGRGVSSGVVADGVSFSPAEARATVAWLNGASKEQLLGAGIAAKQVAIILNNRPWSDIGSFADFPQIGPKTVEAAHLGGNP